MSIKLQTDIGTELMSVAKSPKFHSILGVEQDFICGNDTDKNSEFIEDLMCQQEPVMKVGLRYFLHMCMLTLHRCCG